MWNTAVLSSHTKQTFIALAALFLAGSAGCNKSVPVSKSIPPAAAVDTALSVSFKEVSKEVGIDFVHENGAAGKKNMPETVGSGVAFLDYDNDGWQDVLIVNGTNWPGDKPRHTTMHLYHNNRNGTFTDVTKQAGLAVEMYGMGVAVGDYDNDGLEDIYITAIGPNHLYHNNGNGTFTDVTATAGVPGAAVGGLPLQWKWSSTAAWIDYDNDGKLDLLVCQYVKWSPELNQWCGHNNIRGYCPPNTYVGSHLTLYHNEGGGHFKDVTKETGLQDIALGKSFGIGIADFNGDGFIDIAITNDTWANFLLMNEGGKHFAERGVETGIATGEVGHYKAGMGIDVADWRNNGKFAILIGNFAQEGLSLFERDGPTLQDVLFTDNSHQAGIAEPSLPYLTFGLFFFDYDLDGYQDILTADGYIDDVVATYNSMLSFRERPMVFHNQHGTGFTELGEKLGLTEKVVGRGAASGDFDNDGSLDIALVDNGGHFKLYKNQRNNKNHWVRFRLEGVKANRDGIGALVKVTANGMTQSQYVHSGGSFLSESQRELTFGLANADHAEHVEIIWPGGTHDKVDTLQADRQYLITEGQGTKPDPRTPFYEVKNR
jgi:enediyne biosynthesis protein E4